MQRQIDKGFTIIELLVVVSIITLLIGILLPAVGGARDTALVSVSKSNLRQMAVAHRAYADDWADRQVTYDRDNLGLYCGDVTRYDSEIYGDDAAALFEAHPPIIAGWGYRYGDSYVPYGYWSTGLCGHSAYQPIGFPGGPGSDGWGWFRFGIQTKPMSSYFNGRYYDPVFYAPKEKAKLDRLAPCFEFPGEFATIGSCACGNDWTSYCLSPAGLFNPAVFSDHGKGRFWSAPWRMPAGYRVPSFGHVRYPTLKTHMLEHAWLQNARTQCNGAYFGCEPYAFNHSFQSMPVTLFYDGSVRLMSVLEAMSSDGRHVHQAGHGLWTRDTTFRDDGYLISDGYDFAATSFHILTTEGVRGRDTLGRE
jgi:prepilin-type N-terminal cleavage/methylation domain-containing protein